MPDLYESLLKQDLGHLRIIAELWGIDLETKNVDSARERLTISLLDAGLVTEILNSLSPESKSALTALANAGGRIPWPTFTRRFGEIREAGAGKRDRTKLYLKPISAAEILYYRGLVARAFFNTEKGPQEFAFIPDDLLALLEPLTVESLSAPEKQAESAGEALGRPASPAERGHELIAQDTILDDATTLLAALRMGKNLDAVQAWFETQGLPLETLLSLLHTADLLTNNVPQADSVKIFLEATRPNALKTLQEAWLESDTFNELRLLPGLICEGEWRNAPQETREFLLNLLESIPEDKWWSINAFVRDIKQKYADFQRPAGDYDSWFIKRQADGQYLRGFAVWDQVDGALIRYFFWILHWLGQVDLAVAEGAKEPTAFRICTAAQAQSVSEMEKVIVASQGAISIPRLAPRVVRYQVARFCEWDGLKKEVYRYHVTTNSLNKAREQGLKAEHLLTILARHAEAGLPPAFVKALKRWEANGTEARVQTQIILKVSRPEILEEVRKSRAGKFLGELLGPTTVVVKSGAIQKVLEALTELGFLAEVQTD